MVLLVVLAILGVSPARLHRHRNACLPRTNVNGFKSQYLCPDLHWIPMTFPCDHIFDPPWIQYCWILSWHPLDLTSATVVVSNPNSARRRQAGVCGRLVQPNVLATNRLGRSTKCADKLYKSIDGILRSTSRLEYSNFFGAKRAPSRHSFRTQTAPIAAMYWRHLKFRKRGELSRTVLFMPAIVGCHDSLHRVLLLLFRHCIYTSSARFAVFCLSTD